MEDEEETGNRRVKCIKNISAMDLELRVAKLPAMPMLRMD